MASNDQKPKARLPRGLIDRSAADIRATERMMARIRRVYERYGFEPVETPLIEYTDALGKFLPDQDRPNEGVFSFQDDDEQWLSLRYDLTAPLARYVAENYERLPKPYRSYRAGWVFRNEKPGPGRFRQFMQFDADTVGAASVAADAEMCMMAADTLEELGIPRGQYVIRVNNRKVLDGVMEEIGVADEHQKLAVLRAIDKLDRLGIEGVRELLGPGREDESGDFTKGAGLDPHQVATALKIARGRGTRAPAIRAGPPSAARAAPNSTRSPTMSPPPATAPTASASTPRWCAASNITPARSTRRSCCSRPSTRRASRPASARSAAADAMTGWSAASPPSRFRRPASPSACRACSRRCRRSRKGDDRRRPPARSWCWCSTASAWPTTSRWSPSSGAPTSPPSSISAPPA